jgi:hypothetical protein
MFEQTRPRRPVLIAEGCRIKLRHGFLRVFDECGHFVQALLGRFGLERRTYAALARRAVAGAAILRERRLHPYLDQKIRRTLAPN